MDKGMNFFYILSGPLGYVMEWIYKLLPSYGWDIIIFTLLINIVKIPLQLSQQKSMAKMSAFQPMMMEIQTKYKDKPEKQQEEMLKLQQDYGYSPTAGCVPMLLNFLVMFGVIGVVYNPLERIFHISAAALTAAGEALTAPASPLPPSPAIPPLFLSWWQATAVWLPALPRSRSQLSPSSAVI